MCGARSPRQFQTYRRQSSNAGFSAPKLEWVCENEPRLFERIDRVLLPKDSLRFMLTGEFLSEMSDSSGILWMDVAAVAYDRLQFALLIITVVGLAVSVVFSYMTAHRIAAPAQRLVDSTRRLGASGYSGHIETTGDDEIGTLAIAFNTMSDQIMEREARFRQLAYEDASTGLAHRAGLISRLAQILGLSLISELRPTIAKDELVLHFQPKVQLPSRQADDAEVLVRWQHPQRGFIPPDRFIPFAETSGVIVEITASATMEDADRTLQTFPRCGRTGSPR